jgi:pyruvate/2-oxoglutarate/acetoin dehydrogenase E1 component
MKQVLAIRRALQRLLAERADAVLMGPDVGAWGGVYRATAGLREAFGPDRVIDLAHNPLASFGFARGMALSGRPVVCELAREDAAREAGALAQDIARWSRLRDATVGATWGKSAAAQRGAPSAAGPIVLRVPIAPDADLAPWLGAAGDGVHVLPVASGEDAYAAVAGCLGDGVSVVVALEPESLYRAGEADLASLDATPLAALALPAGVRALTQAPVDGEDLVILAAGAGVPAAREVAAALGRERFAVAAFELRALTPLELGPAREALSRCGRVVLHVDGGPLGERIAGRLAAEAFLSLEAPVRAVPIPAGSSGLLAACRATLDF